MITLLLRKYATVFKTKAYIANIAQEKKSEKASESCCNRKPSYAKGTSEPQNIM